MWLFQLFFGLVLHEISRRMAMASWRKKARWAYALYAAQKRSISREIQWTPRKQIDNIISFANGQLNLSFKKRCKWGKDKGKGKGRKKGKGKGKGKNKGGGKVAAGCLQFVTVARLFSWAREKRNETASHFEFWNPIEKLKIFVELRMLEWVEGRCTFPGRIVKWIKEVLNEPPNHVFKRPFPP